MNMIAGNLSGFSATEGWGVVQGVAYGTTESFDHSKQKKYLSLNAVMGFGNEVRLDVRSTTSDAATREILNRIDYDGLNALLPRPLAHVGSNAKEVPAAIQAQTASRMIETRADLIQQRSAASENWVRSATSQEDAMTVALRQTGLDLEGSMGDADDALSKVMDEVEAEGIANPDDQASLDAPVEAPV